MKRYVLLISALLIGSALWAQSVTYSCRYWFDQNHAQVANTTIGNSLWQSEFDVGQLSDGLHILNIQIADTSLVWNPSKSYLFVKESGDISDNIQYHCWFDQDISTMQSDMLGSGAFLLDVAGLEEGLHTVNIVLEGNAMTSPRSYTFMKVNMEDPTANVQYHCWFDQNISAMQSGLVTGGVFELEVGELSNGFHTVTVLLDNGSYSVPKCYMFYKRPIGGMITKWEYWINDNISNRHTIDLQQNVDTLSIISLLPVETVPIRSSCFHFHPNGDEPYINAKNEITFRFWDANNYFIDKSELYIDENVSEIVVAEILERNTTDTISIPDENQIHWYKIDVGRGDYVAFQADKSCTMQLFAPSGEEVYAVSGLKSKQLNGINVGEDGTYYLAVHDVKGSGEQIAITYDWIYRNSIVSYDVYIVGNGGCSTITYQGNGFNNLLNAYFVSENNDTIPSLYIGHESNTATTVSCNFYGAYLGIYDAVFEFWDETIRINGALQVDEPIDIQLTTTCDNMWLYFKPNPITFKYTITNNGNMSAYAVPIFVYISSPTKDGITHLEIDGLELPSLMDYFDLDSLSLSEKEELLELSEELGDDHNFFMLPSFDEEIGDTIFVRSNYFFMNLAPFETKTLTLKITADEPVEVWVYVPDETIQPLTFLLGRGIQDAYCCAKEWISCKLGLLCSWIDLIDLVVGVIPGVPYKVAVSFVSCVCDIISLMNTQLTQLLCENESPTGFWDMLHKMNFNSMIGAAASCFKEKLLKGLGLPLNILKMFQLINKLKTMFIVGFIDAGYDCSQPMTNPVNCIGSLPKGGQGISVSSFDPNDIFGYQSESGSHYIRQEIQNLHYEIEFENDTTLATAAAHTIIVRDTLDATKFDLNTLAAHSVTIGSKRMELNGEQTFAKTLDMRPELYVIAQVEQDYDSSTGIIQWTISSLDPMTMEPTDNPYQGVLPVNYFGDGVGFIDYSVNLKQTFADGTEISNRAGIIFDSEELIMTPTWTNIVDAIKPTSTIADVTQVADTLNFTFLSEDNRSGVWYHTLYYRNDSTEMDWKVKKSQILENNYIMILDDLQVTEYFVLATDSAGNREDKDFLAEYIYLPDNMTLQNTTLVQGWNWWSTYVEQNDVDGLQMMENSLGNNGLTIKSQDEFTTNYFETIGYNYWYGGLESVDNEQGYMINTNTTCNVKMIGVPASPSDHPITLTPNWNWIGYPVNQSQLLSTALGGFQPEDNDVMKSHSGFATYYDGYGWYPDDFIMTPGEGYLYKSNAIANKSLTYVLNRDVLPEKTTIDERYWTPVINKYAGNISVIAVVEASGVELRDNVEIAAFVDGECRGSAILRYFEPTDRYYAMLSIVGENGDVVDFEMLGAKSDSHITFHTNDVIGNLDNPMVLGFGSNTVDLEVYPNPVDRGKGFFVVVPSWEKPSEILITNALGEIVRKESIVGSTVKGIDTSGIYMVKIICASGNVYMNKLIVK